MSCLYTFFKAFLAMIVIIVGFYVFCFLFFGAIIVDVHRAVEGKDPYFFDPDYIEAYDEPMLDEIYPELLSNYNQHTEEIHRVERSLGFLPDNERVDFEFRQDSLLKISVNYGGRHRYQFPFDHHATENQELLRGLAIRPATIDKLRRQTKAASCISIEKSDALRLGFKNGKSGTFYYRFESSDSENYAVLLDSCLITRINDKVLIEYVGFGRGPDCIKHKNPEGYDERGFFEKWKDLLGKDKKEIFEELFESSSQEEVRE